jgi:large subunit ribosomal protein L21
MYAVIKTGGKQYRVQPGDLLVVEKLEGEPGAEIAFDQVLMLGGADGVTIGAPIIDGASVTATLIETRKGDKVFTVKKIRRQGYRRHKNHRQPESVLRVTGLAGAGADETWDGEVDLTTRATLRERARNLAPRATRPIAEDHALVVQDDDAALAPAPKSAAKKAPVKAAKAKASGSASAKRAPAKTAAPRAAKSQD